jgi:formyltetrahydrofolate synthetase
MPPLFSENKERLKSRPDGKYIQVTALLPRRWVKGKTTT